MVFQEVATYYIIDSYTDRHAVRRVLEKLAYTDVEQHALEESGVSDNLLFHRMSGIHFRAMQAGEREWLIQQLA